MFQQVDINIYGSTIRVQSKKSAALDVLRQEFRFFLNEVTQKPDFLLTLAAEKPPTGLIPLLPASRISQNSLTYDEGARRWNDYFGKALSVYDYDSREGVIYSPDLDLLHEIAYLMILSLTGKDLDRRGYHKIHACAFRYRGRDVVIMLPSKGGKTTLFLELSAIPGVSLLSDDTPLIDTQGRVSPFPLRLGVDELPKLLEGRAADFMLFKRQHFTDKWLIPLDELGAPMARGPGGHVILILGQRWSASDPSFNRLAPSRTLRALAEHMVIGIGLPMVLEYFVRHTWRDWATLIRIGFARVLAAIRLWQNSEAWLFTMGTNPRRNAEKLIQQLDKL